MRIGIDAVNKTFGSGATSVAALSDVSVEVGEGEVVALVGPSGCGKTTLLRSVAGLEAPDTGMISIGDRTVFDGSRNVMMEPENRSVGMVFQSYALWPNMTVERNIDYPLRARRWHKNRRREAVERVLRFVGCEEHAERYPAQLSGGQQQRVALARAVVAEPAVVLFDEPLSNLDARLRDELRFELRALTQRANLTSIYVTHDRNEAWVVADRIVVMNRGRVLQIGTAREILARPQTAFVAQFISDMNLLAGTAASQGMGRALQWGGGLYGGQASGEPVANGERAALCVDLRNVRLHRSEADVPVASADLNVWDAVVVGTVATPIALEAYLQLTDGSSWKVVLDPGHPGFQAGTRVHVSARAADCLLLPVESGPGGGVPPILDDDAPADVGTSPAIADPGVAARPREPDTLGPRRSDVDM